MIDDQDPPPKIAPPGIAGHESWPAFAVQRVAPGAAYAQAAVGAVDLSGQRAVDLRFEEVVFEGANLRGTVWLGATLVDVRLRGCDLSNVDWRHLSAHRVEFEGCNLTGANVAQGQFTHARFRRSKGLLAQWGQAKFSCCAWEDCGLEQADFTDADLHGAALVRCRLSQARFFGAKLQGADLRGSDLAELVITPHELRGAIVEAGQLLQLAPQLGVVLK
jgi:uncharacterized protein YjbI with pentapeptide repeats